MKRNLIILFFVLIIFSSFTSAVDYTDPYHVYQLENSSIFDAIRNDNGTQSGIDFVAGINNNGADFETSESDTITLTVLNNETGTINRTVSLWYKPESVGSVYTLYSDFRLFFQAEAAGTFALWCWGNGDGGASGTARYARITPSGGLNASVWYHIVAKCDGATPTIYANGDKIVDSGPDTPGSDVQDVSIGYFDRTTTDIQFADGIIDEVYIYDILLDDGNVTELFNGTTSFYPFSSPTTDNFTVFSYSNWSGEVIQNFSIEINNNGTIYNTTNGNITTDILKNSTSLWNITIFSDDRFNESYLNYNVSSNLNASLKQSIYNFSVQTAIGLVPQANFSITLNGTTVCNTTTYICNLSYPDSGVYEVIVDSLFDNFNTLNTTLNVTALNNFTYVFNVTQYVLNITAIDITTNTSINTFSTSLIHIAHYPDHIFNSSTTNGWISYETEEDLYNLTIDAPGYALTNTTVTLNITGNLNYTFYLYTTNSINFTFKDEDTLNLLNGTNISFSLIYSTGADNYSTGVGFKYLDNLTADDYEIKYSANGYDSRSFFFTVNNRSTQTINLYLSDSNETTLYIIRVADESDADVVGAKVQLQRQYVELDGQYITIEECDTDSDGECDMFIQESSEIEYRFRVIIDDEIVKTTTPQNIVNIAGENKIITLRISSGLGIFQAYEDIEGLFSNITYNNNTKEIIYYFLDSKNTITRGCLIIQRSTIRNLSIEDVAETCFTGFSGTLTYNISGILQNNTLVYAKGVVDFTNERKYLQTLTISNFINPPNIEDKEFLLFNAFIFIVVALSIILIRNVLLQIFLDFGVIIGLWIIGFNRFGLSLIIGFMVLGFILNWNNKSTSSGGGL